RVHRGGAAGDVGPGAPAAGRPEGVAWRRAGTTKGRGAAAGAAREGRGGTAPREVRAGGLRGEGRRTTTMMTTGDAVEARCAPLGRCLFCWRRFRENHRLAHLPLGTRIAFDPVGGRLWVICPSCHRWNLCPIEERVAALHELERLATDRGRQIAATAHVELLEADGLVLLRVGR